MAEVVGLAAAVAQLAGLTVELTKLSYSYLTDVRNASKARKTYLQEVSALTDVLLRLEMSIQDSDSGVNNPISSTTISECHEVLSLQRSALERNFNKLLWPFQEKELKKAIESVHRFRGLFADYIVADTSLKLSSTSRKVDSLRYNQTRSQLQSWLKQKEGLSKTIPTPIIGTGQWFVNHAEFQGWLTETPSILWCRGPPGVGKSLLAAIVIEELSKNPISKDFCIAHYFCDFTARKQQTESAILQCLLRQVVSHGSEEAISLLSEHRGKLTSTPKADDLATAFSEVCHSQKKLFLIVDAIDELENAKQVVSRLRDFQVAGCSILITSRDSPDISRILTSFREINLQRSHQQDMHTYIRNRFLESDFADAIAQTESIAEAVVQNSDGLFLLAKLTMDHLLEFPTIKKMRKALTDLPKQLNDAFDTSVARIDAQPKALREVAHRLIGWIVSAERPLRTAEVTHAFAVDPGDEEVDEENMVMLATLLRACAGLVAVDKDRDNFGMVHKLAHEFFQRRYAEATSIHEDMARTSIAYLSLRTLRSGPCSTIDAMDDRLSGLPFLQYAARHWGEHAMMPGVESSVREPTRVLLDDPGLRNSAFEVLNYRDDMANRDIAAAIFDSLPKGQSQLHIAAHWGFESIAKDILEAGGDCNAADYQGWTPLHWATSRGHVNTMRILIESGADVNIQDAQGWTPLTWSSFNGSVPATELLLEKGARYLGIDVHGWTALHWAVSRQKPDIVRLLLKHHREYKDFPERGRVRAATTLPSDSDHFKDSRPPSAIELAAVRADVESFDLLLKAGDCQDNDFNHWIDAGGFDPPMSNMWRTMNKAERHHGMDYYIARSVEYSTPDDASDTWRAALLHSAIKDDKFEIVQLLLSMGTDVNAQTHARSALHAAACKEDPRFAEILLENHADVSELDLHDQTALHQAILNGFYETADVLIRGGSDVNARMSKKAQYGQYSLRRALPVKGMGIDLKRGAILLTPLMLVTGLKCYGEEDESRTAQANISKLLLSNGADVSLADEGGRTCLHMAAYAGNEDLALRLLAAGAEVNRRDGRKATPLHYACQFGHVAMTRTLLEAGADPSARDSFGFAVIHGAALSCNIEVVRLLVERDVDIYAIDNLGRTALHYFATGSNRTESASEDLRHIFRWLYPVPDLGRLNAAAQYDRDRSEFASFSGSYQLSLSRKHTPLSMTLSDSNWEVFHLLREADAEISEPSEDFFRQAVHSIQPKALQYLLEKGVTPEIKESIKKSTPDFYVSKDIDPDELDALLPALISLGFDINTVSYGRSKLGTAATTTNSAHLARVLLRHGANPYTGHPDLDSFLLAATCQNWDLLHALLLHSPRPTPEGHWTQHLDDAAASQHDEPERLCIALQRSGFTAEKGHKIFSEAVRNRSEKLARLLITHGLNVNKQDECGWTPLHYAVLYQIVPAVTDLLQAGANVDTAAICWFNSSWTGPRPSALDSNNPWTGTALHLATLVANEQIVSMLLDRGADVDAGTGCNSKGFWPLHGPRALHIALGTGTSYSIDAACLGHARLSIARMLIERGACVTTVADHLRMPDLKRFKGYEDVWEAVRVGITDE